MGKSLRKRIDHFSIFYSDFRKKIIILNRETKLKSNQKRVNVFQDMTKTLDLTKLNFDNPIKSNYFVITKIRLWNYQS